MKKTNKVPKFLVTSPANYLDETSKRKQISSARSHVASHRHARDRLRDEVQSTAAVAKQTHKRSDGVIQENEQLSGMAHDPHVPEIAISSSFAELYKGSPEEGEQGSMQGLIEGFGSSTMSLRSVPSNASKYLSQTHTVDAFSSGAPHENLSYDAQTFIRLPTWRSRGTVIGSEHDTELRKDQNDALAESSTLVTRSAQPLVVYRNVQDLDEARRSTSPEIAQISATLDPFVQLPIEVTAMEKSLLHFYLTYGRRWLWGTSQNPRHCPAFYVARNLMQVSPIYVLTNIVIAESTLSRATNRQMRPEYYQRRAQMYKMVSGLLSSKAASLHQQTFAAMSLAIVEYSSGNIQAQALHVQAVDEMIESIGGIAAFGSRFQDATLQPVTTRFYVVQFLRSEVRISSLQYLDIVRRRFIQSLYRIRKWFATFHDQKTSSDTVSVDISDLELLSDYLYHLIEVSTTHSSEPKPFSEISGAHFCALSLCMTMVEYDLSPPAPLTFLQRTQDAMRDSVEISHEQGHGLRKLHTYAAAHVFSHMRSELLDDFGEQKELAICQSVVDAQKMFVLLGEVTRARLSTWLVQCIQMLTDKVYTSNFDTDLFGPGWFISLDQEILDSWASTDTAQPEF